MRRHDFIALTGALPLLLRAHSVPVIGFLNGGSPEGFSPTVNAFREGCGKFGYVAGQYVAVKYRWANDRFVRSDRTDQ